MGACPRGMVEGILYLRQHVLGKNPKEEARGDAEKEQDAAKSNEEDERPGKGEDTCDCNRSESQANKNAEERLKEDMEGIQNADEVDELQFQDPAERHVQGGTWLAQPRRDERSFWAENKQQCDAASCCKLRGGCQVAYHRVDDRRLTNGCSPLAACRLFGAQRGCNQDL
ncbi:hypothetical protein NDU88_011281 [Pleurodeles waltl]|uniref:Uncharacterized protein n=1 Tax=Pleurodeles waltl TaxID=8319 RepID=A0AAV7QWS6_PLEWA|nr:hypothetical protein NDU88_011281 [Pleurodeles waltl]